MIVKIILSIRLCKYKIIYEKHSIQNVNFLQAKVVGSIIYIYMHVCNKLLIRILLKSEYCIVHIYSARWLKVWVYYKDGFLIFFFLIQQNENIKKEQRKLW